MTPASSTPSVPLAVESVFDAKVAMLTGLKQMELDADRSGEWLPYAESIMRAEPMWVDHDLSNVVLDASQSVSVEEKLRQETIFPAPEGFCLLDLRKPPRWAIAWWLTDDLESVGGVGIMLDPDQVRPWPCPFVWDFGEGFEPGRYLEVPTDNEDERAVFDQFASGIASLALALWKIAAERIASRSRIPLERHARKRVAKLELEPSDVTVIRLRRLKSSPGSEGEAVEYSHRFLVRGHWRNQWYPLDQEHRQRWVSTYVKGPSNKPLILKPRRFELTR